MEYHKQYVNDMCRICANRAQKSKEIFAKKPPKYVSNYSDMIYVLFGVDTASDISSIHPPKICDDCYQLIMNSKKTGTQGKYCHEMNLDGIYGTLKDKVSHSSNIWKSHTDLGCVVCETYRNQSKGGWPRKTKKGGSIKLLFDTSSPDIFNDLFCEDTSVNSKLTHCDIVIPEIQKPQFICAICHEILSPKSVSTGCHHFCSCCLSQVFITNRKNTISCPVCYKEVNVTNVSAIDEACKNILNNLMIRCNLCKYQGPADTVEYHDCYQVSIKYGYDVPCIGYYGNKYMGKSCFLLYFK